MLKRHLSRRLKVGRFLGIELFIHWSYWLLPLAVGGWSLGIGEGWQSALVNVLRIFALFVCVTLHEYGHAMAARTFGVRTVDITLLPIGGLARLERMPRIPWQEFLVAVAGPAVNVVIAGALIVGLLIFVPDVRSGSLDVLEPILLTTTAGWLLAVNVSLVLFNMVPAFPMDGGRVLRSVLAMGLDYRRATRIAARVGLVAAALMAFVGFLSQALVLVLIAAFIGYAGWMEARQVDVSESIRGVRVEEAMISAKTSVRAMDSLSELADFFSRHAVRSVPVVGIDEYYLGMLDIAAVVAAAREGRRDATAMDLLQQDYPVVRAPGSLEAEIGGVPPRGHSVVPVVDQRGRLLGSLDFETLVERIALSRSRSAAAPVIDAVLVPSDPAPSRTDTYI